MSTAGGDGKTPTPYMNVTPLVDVCLVILIIFMIVTPLMTKVFWLNLPKKDEDAENKPPPPSDNANKPLVMTVDKAGKIRVNKTLLRPGEISGRLPRMLAAQKRKVLYFDAHDDVAYGEAVKAMDLARNGGARSIAILTQNVVK
jgi:biopolymer transport protein ExbD/biopolymer transport protein TolR